MLRETAQTLDEDLEALADLSRHRFCSTNNLWFDLAAMRDELDRRDGILGLPMIRNAKTVDPADPTTPEVIQIETAMGAAIEVFDGRTTIEVGRDRFVPVKTTNDLLVLRSDCYELDERRRAAPGSPEQVPFVDLDRLLQAGRGVRRALPRRGAVACGGRPSLWSRGTGRSAPTSRRRRRGRGEADTGSPGTMPSPASPGSAGG